MDEIPRFFMFTRLWMQTTHLPKKGGQGKGLLVRPCDDYSAFSRLAAYHVGTRSLVESERNAADGSLSIFLDTSLGLFCAVPMAEEEAALLYAPSRT